MLMQINTQNFFTETHDMRSPTQITFQKLCEYIDAKEPLMFR